VLGRGGARLNGARSRGVVSSPEAASRVLAWATDWLLGAASGTWCARAGVAAAVDGRRVKQQVGRQPSRREAAGRIVGPDAALAREIIEAPDVPRHARRLFGRGREQS